MLESRRDRDQMGETYISRGRGWYGDYQAVVSHLVAHCAYPRNMRHTHAASLDPLEERKITPASAWWKVEPSVRTRHGTETEMCSEGRNVASMSQWAAWPSFGAGAMLPVASGTLKNQS